jgi:uncharacterized metal-binding protein YceD (DUF177 family)
VRRDDLLDLNDVLQHPGRTLAVDISTELAEEEDLDLVTPLEGYLEAISSGNLLLVKGDFSTRTVLECSRCSGPIEVDVKFEIDEQFNVVGVPSSLSHQDFAKVEADEPYPLFEGNNLMVEALLRQSLLLNMPVQTLCEFGWDGDCPIAKQRESIRKEDFSTRAEFEKLRSVMRTEEDAVGQESGSEDVGEG